MTSRTTNRNPGRSWPQGRTRCITWPWIRTEIGLSVPLPWLSRVSIPEGFHDDVNRFSFLFFFFYYFLRYICLFFLCLGNENIYIFGCKYLLCFFYFCFSRIFKHTSWLTYTPLYLPSNINSVVSIFVADCVVKKMI